MSTSRCVKCGNLLDWDQSKGYCICEDRLSNGEMKPKQQLMEEEDIKLRKALDFYANKLNWAHGIPGEIGSWSKGTVQEDFGKIAREALYGKDE